MDVVTRTLPPNEVSEANPWDTDRFWTVPNVLSVIRLIGVPIFLWLALGPRADGWAVAVLAWQA
ncbi:CDP-diacylglycerol-glycerol-3-phosphate 3-phosphatidyltransferase [Cutibacterium acnes JCM 18916]|nr:CDP-diacylglycerol-glycerol-3-phosphate 3-phosphatidyltransferase [Cutibacterium acnes JCM 18916]